MGNQEVEKKIMSIKNMLYIQKMKKMKMII